MTAAAIAEVAPKLAKLLPLLASDKDGEVVAAARAIGRTLRRANVDWHDLVRALTKSERIESDYAPGRDLPDLPFILRRLHRHPALTEWESNFIHSIVQQQARGRALSDKQRAVVINTWERLQ